MRVVILAGGLGSRLSEETVVKPKPMVEIGGRPILWHIMKLYSSFGLDEFVVCCGYRGDVIKEWFANYHLRSADVTFDLRDNSLEIHRASSEPWRVTLVDTGEHTMTGGRLKRVRDYLPDTFCLTYGDGLSDVDVPASIEHHRSSGALVTMTAVQPPGRFGAFRLAADAGFVSSFREKPDGDGAWINGGFFVCEPEALDAIEGDDTTWEREPLERLAAAGRLAAFRHEGFWQPMDTFRDKDVLEQLWASGAPPWKRWD